MSRFKSVRLAVLIAIGIWLTSTSTGLAQGGFRYGNTNGFRGGFSTQNRFNAPPNTFRSQSSIFVVPGVPYNQGSVQYPAPPQSYNSGYRGNYQGQRSSYGPYDSAPAYNSQSFGNGYYQRGYYYSP